MKRSAAARVYDLLLHVVPDDGTTRREMREVLRDAHRDAAARGFATKLRLWCVAVFDITRTAIALRRPSPGEFLDSAINDVRLGCRAVRKSPGFSAVVVLTICGQTMLLLPTID